MSALRLDLQTRLPGKAPRRQDFVPRKSTLATFVAAAIYGINPAAYADPVVPILAADENARSSIQEGASASSVASGAANPTGSAAEGKKPAAQGEHSSQTLQEIVVMGRRPEFFRALDASSVSKFDVPIQDIPQSVSVLTGDFIETANIQSIEDASKYVPGLADLGLNGFGEPRSTFASRGTVLGTGRSFKLDNYSFAFQGILDMTGIERMEFVRGPASIAYGVVSYGGIINLITKKPERELSVSGELGFGSYDNYRIEGDVNVPLTADGDLRARLSAGYTDGESFRVGEQADLLTLTPALEYDITDSLLLSYNGYFQNADNVAGGTLPVFEDGDGNTVLPTKGILSRDTFTGNPEYNRSDNEIRASVLKLRYRPSESTTVTAAVNQSKSNLNLRSAYTESYYGPVSIDPNSSYYGYVYSYSQELHHELEVFNVELSLQHDFEAFSREHTVFVLAGYEDWTFTDGYATACTGGIDIFDFETTELVGEMLPLDDIVNQTGDYCFGNGNYDQQKDANFGIQGQFELTGKLKLTLGARYDDIDVFYASGDGGFTLDQILVTGSVLADHSTDELTYRAGLVYELTPQINAYAMTVDGFQPQVGTTREGGVVGNEHGTLYEVGAKAVFLGESLGINLAVFDMDIDDDAISDPENGPGDDFVIAGGAEERSGWEIEIMGQLSENWSIAANYAYVTGSVTAAPQDPFLLGRDLELGPNRSGSIFLNYTAVTNNYLDGLNLGASYFYASEQTPSINVDYKIPSYNLLEIYAAYPLTTRVEIGINLSNVLDESYVLPSQSEYGVNYGEPRAFYAYIRMSL
ncbi:MAG TPA: TonB-dependent siderophore receptor [Woeseiaceae bacterium]|nr:TonB-dependent siderophore receptor [Woeseiaceae bacterium]